MFFNKGPVFNLFPGGFTEVNRSAGNAWFEMEMAAEADVIQDRHAAEHLHFLKCSRNAQFGPFKWFEAIDILFSVINISFLWSVKAVDTVHHHCLTSPVGPDDRMNLSFSDFQADIGQGKNFSETHMNILYFQEDVLFFKLIRFSQYY